MAFTDSELQYLKVELPHNESILFQYARKAFRLDALIARLEASEAHLKACEIHHGFDENDQPFVDAWKKASGHE